MHAGIAVAVRTVDLAVRGERGVRAAMEWLSAHEGGWLSWNPELEKDLSVQGDLAHEMAAIVCEEHRVVWRHMDAVRSRVLSFAPRPQNVTFAIEDDHRVLTAVENVNVVVVIDADPANLLEGPTLWQFCPVGDNAVLELAGSDDHRTLPALASIRDRSIAMAIVIRKLLCARVSRCSAVIANRKRQAQRPQ